MMAPRPRPLLFGIAVGVALAGASPFAFAEVHCRALASGTPRLESIDADARLGFIRERLRVAARQQRIWTATWVSLYGAVTTFNAVELALARSHDDTVDHAIGVGASLVGLVFTSIPAPTLWEAAHLEAHVAAAPPDPEGDRCALLSEAEWRLQRSARADAFSVSPLVHFGNFAVNLGIAVSLLVLGHYQTAAIQGLVGIAVGEIQTATRPTVALKALARYRAGFLDKRPLPPPLAWGLAPSAAEGRYGISFALAW